MTDLATVAVFGWVLAALALGLWWGERGRRLDLQFLLRTGNRTGPQAKVVQPEKQKHDSTTPAGAFTEEDREEWIEQVMTEMAERGQPIDRETAASQVEDMIAQAYSQGLV